MTVLIGLSRYAEKTAAEYKAACEDSCARGGADPSGTNPEEEDEELALDDALDAMLDAQSRSTSNLFDDFDEMEGAL